MTLPSVSRFILKTLNLAWKVIKSTLWKNCPNWPSSTGFEIDIKFIFQGNILQVDKFYLNLHKTDRLWLDWYWVVMWRLVVWYLGMQTTKKLMSSNRKPFILYSILWFVSFYSIEKMLFLCIQCIDLYLFRSLDNAFCRS